LTFHFGQNSHHDDEIPKYKMDLEKLFFVALYLQLLNKTISKCEKIDMMSNISDIFYTQKKLACDALNV